MAYVKFKNIPNVKERIQREFKRIKTDPRLLREIGQVCVENIVGYARAGRTPGTTKKSGSFPYLSIEWLLKRDYLLKHNTPSEFFLGSFKSNLTFTGKLLESVGFKVDAPNGLVKVDVDGNHHGYKTGSGRGDSVPNKTIVEGLEKRGFVFLVVSDQLRKRVNVLTKRFIRKLIRDKQL